MYPHKFIYYLLFCMIGLNAIGQSADPILNDRQVDSLLKASGNTVYENPDKSIQVGLSVFENENTSVKNKVRGLMLVSLAYTSKRDYQKALEYIIKANELANQLDNRILNIETLTKTGILYQQLKIFDKSLEYLDRSERLSLAYPNRDSIGMVLGNTFLVKGFIYKDNLNCDIALEFFDKGIREYERLNSKSVYTNLSIAHYNKGNCYTLLADYGMAKTSFNRSIVLAKQVKAKSLIAFGKKGLAEVYTLEGRYQESVALLQEALEQSSSVGDLILNQGIYEGLFKNYLALNQWNEYQNYYNLYLKTQLEIQVSERNSISDSIDENYKIQDEQLNAIKKRFKHQVEIIIMAAIIIIAIFIFLDFKNRKNFKKLQKRIDDFQKSKV